MSTAPRLLILNDTSDHSNWGSQSNIEALYAILRASLPGATFTSLPSRWVGRVYRFDPFLRGRRAFNRTSVLADLFNQRFQQLPVVADEFDHVADLWMKGRGGRGAEEFLAALPACDAVIFNAEGSTYRNNLSAVKCLFMLWLARTRFQRPAFFLNGSVSLTDIDAMLPAMVRKTFAVLDGITVREPNSLRLVQRYAPEARVELVPDSVFRFDAADAAAAEGGLADFRRRVGSQPYFCFSLSMLPVDYRRTRRESALYRVITALKSVVPQAVLMAKDAEDQFLRDLAADTQSIFFGHNRTFRDVMAVLQQAQFLFSGRYHHLIMASNVGCPSIPLISTSPKVQGLCELLGPSILPPFDPTDLWRHAGAIEQEARRLATAGPAVRADVAAAALRLRGQVHRLGDIVGAGYAAARSTA